MEQIEFPIWWYDGSASYVYLNFTDTPDYNPDCDVCKMAREAIVANFNKLSNFMFYAPGNRERAVAEASAKELPVIIEVEDHQAHHVIEMFIRNQAVTMGYAHIDRITVYDDMDKSKVELNVPVICAGEL